MTKGVHSPQITSRTDRSGSGDVRCTDLKLMNMAGQDINSIQPNQEFRVEVTFESKAAIKDLRISIDVDTMDGSRITTLYSGFQDAYLVIDQGFGQATCYVSGLNLRPDDYTLNIMLGHSHGQYDFIKEVVTLTVEETDFFMSGRMPDRIHGPLLTHYKWATK